MMNPQNYKARSEKQRLVETIAGLLLIGASIAGSLFLEGDKTLMLVFAGLGGLFISKSKTLELLDAIAKKVAS
jgi:hypothetical protein